MQIEDLEHPDLKNTREKVPEFENTQFTCVYIIGVEHGEMEEEIKKQIKSFSNEKKCVIINEGEEYNPDLTLDEEQGIENALVSNYAHLLMAYRKCTTYFHGSLDLQRYYTNVFFSIILRV